MHYASSHAPSYRAHPIRQTAQTHRCCRGRRRRRRRRLLAWRTPLALALLLPLLQLLQLLQLRGQRAADAFEAERVLVVQGEERVLVARWGRCC